MKSALDKSLLILLRRDVMSWVPNPLPLKTLPCLEEGRVKALTGKGIRSTKVLLIRLHEDGITDLADAVSMEPSELRMAAGRADLGRVNSIGPAFLAMLEGQGFIISSSS